MNVWESTTKKEYKLFERRILDIMLNELALYGGTPIRNKKIYY